MARRDSCGIYCPGSCHLFAVAVPRLRGDVEIHQTSGKFFHTLNLARQLGIATSNKPNPIFEDPANAFDGSLESKWTARNANSRSSPYLQYKWNVVSAEPIMPISSYRLTSANDEPGKDPKSWILQASNNGQDYDTLDAHSGIVFASRFEVQRFSDSVFTSRTEAVTGSTI